MDTIVISRLVMLFRSAPRPTKRNGAQQKTLLVTKKEKEKTSTSLYLVLLAVQFFELL